MDKPSGLEADKAFEAIFALNMGDFVAEHLISGDLMDKISHTISQNPAQLRKQLQELIEIYSLDNTLSLLGFQSSQGFVLYDSMATSLADMLQVDACHIFQTITKADKQQFLSLSGSSVAHPPQDRWTVGYDLENDNQLYVEAYYDGFPMVMPSLPSPCEGWTPLDELHQAKTNAFIAIPLEEGQKHYGLIVFETYEPRDFSQETIELAEYTGKVMVVSMHLQRLLDHAKRLVEEPCDNAGELKSLRAQITDLIGDLGRYQQFFIEALANAIDARNNYTYGHSQGVAQVAKGIAEAMKLNEKTVDLVYYAGLLGALGRIHIPQDILTKEDALSTAEKETLKNSPNVGVGLLMKMNFLAEVIPYVDYQRERWDGQDSPHGLAGRSIPLGARIIAVADAYHALTHPRPYRPTPLKQADALTLLQSEAGSKWDPDVVESLAKMLSDSNA